MEYFFRRKFNMVDMITVTFIAECAVNRTWLAAVYIGIIGLVISTLGESKYNN